MVSFNFLANPNTPRTLAINLTMPAGTKTGRVCMTPNGGVEALVPDAVTSVTDTTATVVIPAHLVTEANFPATFRLEISVNGGAFTDYGTGRGRLASLGTAPGGSASTTGPNPFEVQNLALRGLFERERTNGQHRINFEEATEFSINHSTLPPVVTGAAMQVSGNKLYGATSASYGYYPLPRNIAWGEKFHFSTFADLVGNGGNVFLGISFTDRTATTTSLNDDIAVGFAAGGITRAFAGTSAVTTGAGTFDNTSWAGNTGRYNIVIDSDGENISFSIRNRDNVAQTTTWAIRWSAIANTKVIGRVMVYAHDSRALTGISLGPALGNLGTIHQNRTKTVAGYTIENSAARDLKRWSRVSPNEEWRLSLPTNYDARRPAPLAIFFHPAQSSAKTADRPWVWAAERSVTTALNDAGYIVATAQDGYISGQPNTDRYANDTSMAEMTALEKYVRETFAVNQTVFFGVSMGMITGLNLLARRTVPNVTACYFINGGMDILSLFKNPSPVYDVYRAPLRAAYNITNDAEADVKMAGRDNSLRPWHDFRGVPIRIVSADSDDLLAPSGHEAFLQKFRPYVPEASQLIIPGEHTSTNQYVASDVMEFFNKYVA